MKITLPTQKSRKTKQGSIYERLETRFTTWWSNIFLKPFVILFFLAQFVIVVLLGMILPMGFIGLGYNGWGILIYEAVVLYLSFLLCEFWIRVYDRYRP